MAIQKVDESLIDGVRSLMSFGLMLREAMRTAGFGAIAWATNTEAYGFSAGADGLRFWVSVPFEEPDVLRVQATPIDRVKAEALEEGNRPSAVSEAYWHFTHNLSELGFFALEAQAQSEFLKDKLRQDLEAFRSIRKAPTV